MKPLCFQYRVQSRRSKVRGSALAIVLILLLGIAMLALMANRSAILESKSARASRDHMIARAAAESAILDFNKAMGSKDARVFQRSLEEKLASQMGGCSEGGSVPTAGTPDGTGTQKAGGTASPGIVDFSACVFAGGEWWQSLTLSQIEALSAEIGAITGEASTGYEGTLGRSAAKPRVIIEPLDFMFGGGSAAASGAGASQSGRDSQTKVFRVTALGYGPSRNTVVMLQETWRTQD